LNLEHEQEIKTLQQKLSWEENVDAEITRLALKTEKKGEGKKNPSLKMAPLCVFSNLSLLDFCVSNNPDYTAQGLSRKPGLIR